MILVTILVYIVSWLCSFRIISIDHYFGFSTSVSLRNEKTFSKCPNSTFQCVFQLAAFRNKQGPALTEANVFRFLSVLTQNDPFSCSTYSVNTHCREAILKFIPFCYELCYDLRFG